MRWRDLPVLVRNELWVERKRARIERIKEAEKDSDLVGCTFEPQICSYKPPRPTSKASECSQISAHTSRNGSRNRSYSEIFERRRRGSGSHSSFDRSRNGTDTLTSADLRVRGASAPRSHTPLREGEGDPRRSLEAPSSGTGRSERDAAVVT